MFLNFKKMDDKKSLFVSKKTHKLLKDYCKKNALKMHDFADIIISNHLNQKDG